MAKPDNRANNAVRQQHVIDNTVQKLHESAQYLSEHADEISVTEREALQAKNERRRSSIEGLADERRDEISDAQS
ncbi:small acid-soluble spore protein Tlp [Paenibacillus apiarius]|uniref:Small acid-soluble spore protein Tlp n=1 Tax=Paenibacillus apiarius TaxID=46240 RepID=A0ABT4DPS0_9BACL|nr:small acid-soluble spore protein Tlp [Paenibacillus apiarius]MBN3524688.1 small acid-soluble spore protein Tlp [Paenibacillus apiarius]MCY9515576.1 small acid-soluble spore protein Tlp [Paenibacillus apiarius]MCY9519351.1 small acid-soluble spore protein Tlp [Paenibacillus apiarius]MCY9550987.1 small acid-soluble spore protein Tlp [Paenibacillus apiarius]MCY9558921.1 small acid-soluble spore protein Tlp [Paenibacillus apiarius]